MYTSVILSIIIIRLIKQSITNNTVNEFNSEVNIVNCIHITIVYILYAI